ncbi:MAG: cell wall hydrolase [Holosporaceae bacterium]|nr:MAG: cell wall hydrolase [Holosporaceae bacterium]
MQAIAHVILNRMRDKNNWPSSIKEVILQKNSFLVE